MATVAEGLAKQIANIEAQYGKKMSAWFAIIAKSGLAKHGEVVSFLKEKHGLPHGAAHRISLESRAATSKESGEKPGLYEGKKAALWPIHEKLVKTIRAFGDDLEEAPKTGYVSLRRKKQFAMIKPASKHVDVGLILPKRAVTDRLESAKTFNALFTHRVRVSSPDEVDKELVAWLSEAYEGAK
jgi:hypothetical protein